MTTANNSLRYSKSGVSPAGTGSAAEVKSMRVFAFALLLAVSHVMAADDEPIIKLVKSKVKDPGKPFTLLVMAKVKDGTAAKLESAFAPCAAATRKEPGCAGYDLHNDTDKPGNVVLIERWKSVAALEAHLKQPYTQAFLKTMPEWSGGAPDFKILVPVE
jgi:quinol monooxygenase YgiN